MKVFNVSIRIYVYILISIPLICISFITIYKNNITGRFYNNLGAISETSCVAVFKCPAGFCKTMYLASTHLLSNSIFGMIELHCEGEAQSEIENIEIHKDANTVVSIDGSEDDYVYYQITSRQQGELKIDWVEGDTYHVSMTLSNHVNDAELWFVISMRPVDVPDYPGFKQFPRIIKIGEITSLNEKE